MSEPMLDKFLLSLQKENFTLKDVLTRDIASQEEYMQVYQAVLYLDKEHINTVLEGFKKLSADKQKLVVKNLIQLYPMSQHLLNQILYNYSESDSRLVDGFDENEQILMRISSVVKEMDKYMHQWTKKSLDYKNDIDQLIKKRENYKQAVEEDKEYLLKREEINHEIELLKKEATSENRQKRLTEKRVELEKLKHEKESFLRENKELNDKKKKLVAELQKMQNNLGSDEDKQLLQQLLKRLPKDEGDGI